MVPLDQKLPYHLPAITFFRLSRALSMTRWEWVPLLPAGAPEPKSGIHVQRCDGHHAVSGHPSHLMGHRGQPRQDTPLSDCSATARLFSGQRCYLALMRTRFAQGVPTPPPPPSVSSAGSRPPPLPASCTVPCSAMPNLFLFNNYHMSIEEAAEGGGRKEEQRTELEFYYGWRSRVPSIGSS